MPLLLHKISLTCFRNHEALRIDLGGALRVVLTGPNGAGKTNILEAVSLLAPGKGLRGADLPDIAARGLGEPWAVAAELQTAQGQDMRIGTGLAPAKSGEGLRRIVRIDGKTARSQTALSSHVAAVWLTPQMDRIFLEGASVRRRFLDRLVFAYAPDHIGHIGRYEKNQRERLRLLTGEKKNDPVWLAALEAQMAADAVSISAARLHLVEKLSAHVEALAGQQSLFPAPRLRAEGKVESLLSQKSALDAEDDLRVLFARARQIDAAAGRTHEGAHRSDLRVYYAAKDMPAGECSTGEQKGLLLSIILAHARMMRAEKGFVPLLLLDEVAAHLDDARRAQLFAHLSALGGQVWLTGTDAGVFAGLAGEKSCFIDVSGAGLVRRMTA